MNHTTNFQLHTRSTRDCASTRTEITVRGTRAVLTELRKYFARDPHGARDTSNETGTEHNVRVVRGSDGREVTFDTYTSWNGNINVSCGDVSLGSYAATVRAHEVAMMAMNDAPSDDESNSMPKLRKPAMFELYRQQVAGRAVAGAYVTDNKVGEYLVAQGLCFYRVPQRTDTWCSPAVHLTAEGARVTRQMRRPNPADMAKKLSKNAAKFMRDTTAMRWTANQAGVAKVHANAAHTLCGYDLCTMHQRNNAGSSFYKLSSYGWDVANALVAIEIQRDTARQAKAGQDDDGQLFPNMHSDGTADVLLTEAIAAVTWAESDGHTCSIQDALKGLVRKRGTVAGELDSMPVWLHLIYGEEHHTKIQLQCDGYLVFEHNVQSPATVAINNQVELACVAARAFVTWYAETRQRHQTGVHMSVDQLAERIEALDAAQNMGSPFKQAKNAATRIMMRELHKRAKTLALGTRQNYSL